VVRCKELIKVLKNERLNVSLRAGKADYFQWQYELLQEKLNAQGGWLIDSGPSKQLSSDEDVVMRSETSLDSITGHPKRVESSLITSVGPHMACQNGPLLRCPDDDTLPAPSVQHNDNNIVHLAAVHDDLNILCEREFRVAHNYKSTPREQPHTSGNDHQCMAVLMRVNGLDAYSLLDTGSMTMSIMHDFAQVAKLTVCQLENLVVLQLRTVGSRSMINFGTRT